MSREFRSICHFAVFCFIIRLSPLFSTHKGSAWNGFQAAFSSNLPRLRVSESFPFTKLGVLMVFHEGLPVGAPTHRLKKREDWTPNFRSVLLRPSLAQFTHGPLTRGRITLCFFVGRGAGNIFDKNIFLASREVRRLGAQPKFELSWSIA
jgi:hypothetical protein